MKIPLIVRSTVNATGAITFTGNTLGLSRSEVSAVPGTADSIGAFVTTNTALRYGTYPFGTTDNYLLNSSSAILNLPGGSSIIYAELIWGGTYANGTTNLTSAIDNPVSFTTPAGTFNVSPDSATSNNFDLGGGALGYVRTSNVTSLIQQGGAGTYTTGRVVGTLTISSDPTANNAGWTLGVIYQNASLPFRNMSLRAGAVLVQSTSSAVTTTLTGFSTPVSGALGGRALFSAQEGDANRNGDQALFGPTTATLVALSGTNNFANNFFASQINNDSGALDTTGTFGTRNQTNGAPGSNISGGRQGWDITNVDVSARLVNNQTSAVLRLTTSGDAYVLNANALQIDINAPRVGVTKSANVSGTLVGDTIRYTVTVTNTGTANATDMVVTDTLPAGLTFVAGSVTVAGVARPTNDITAGVPIGTLAPGASVAVAYSARVTSMPGTQLLVNTANASFNFQSVAGGPITPAVIPSNGVTTPVFSPILVLNKTANTTNATVGSTVTYTIVVSNSGNIAGTTTVTDPIPAGSTFVPNSVTVNGVTVPGANIASGVSAGSIAPNSSATVTFQVLVQSLPSPPQMVNQASAAYTFTVPDGRTSSGSAASNTVTIPVALPNVTVVKSSSVPDASVGETYTYTVVVSNNGIAAVTNVTLTDALPSGAVLVPGSVTINGAPQPSANPANGIAIGALNAGSSTTVTFQVTSSSLPSPAQFVNRASAAYSSGAFNGVSLSNTVTVPVFQPIISTVKSVNSSVATVGDTLTYSVFVSNTGNLAAQQATLTDTLPSGTSFVPGSVTVNTVSVPGASPLTGIPLGFIAPGSTVPVTFRFILNTLPSPPRVVNQATTTYSYQLPSGRSFTGLTNLSNVVDIPATSPNVTVTKAVSSTTATLNDILTYTINVTNNGVAAVTNTVFSDNIPSGATLVPGSVVVNGVTLPNADPAGGISLGTINAGASVPISFNVRVTSVPPTIPANLSNRANVSFTSGSFSGSSSSPLVTTATYLPVITLAKSSSVSTLTVGDTFTFSLTVTNAGNYPADVLLTDILPPGAVFVTNSVVINGFPNPGADPNTGIPLNTVTAGAVNVVSFSVTVVSLPNPQQIVNQANAIYTYTLPDGRIFGANTLSNIVTVSVSTPNVAVVKSSNVIDAVSGDTVTYTVLVTNNGAAPINNAVLSDMMPQGTTFISGSVFVNGSPLPLANPAAGIPIGTLAPSASATVTFEVIVNMPVPSVISNQSTVSFTSGAFSSASLSNNVNIPVTQPVISLVKTADTNNASVGGTIVYTVAVSNTGNVTAQVAMTDIIPAGTTFIPNSVVVSGMPVAGADPATGIPVGPVAPGATVIVTFSVLVTSLPTPQQLSNQASASYTFVPPDGRTLTGSALSNIVTFPVSAPNITLVKTSTTTNTAIGDIVPYSILVTNVGIAAVTNTVFIDPIAPGSTFVLGSVAINGVPAPSAFPAAGIPVGTIPPGGTVTVTFNALVQSLPPSGALINQSSATFTSGAFSGTAFSNTSVIAVNQPIITAVKSASVTTATVGDTLNYTINVTNSGNFGAATTVTDTIPAGTSFIPNSVIVNGVPQAAISPVTGIPIGIVAPGVTIPVTFSVLIDFLPTPQQLLNQATASFQFTLPDGRPFTGSVNSNTVTVGVTAPNVAVVKTTPTTVTTVGDTITYTINVTNFGIAGISNTLLTDPIPAGTAFVPGSVTVNGVPQPTANPAAGIPLGAIAPGVLVPVTFSVTVTSVPNPAIVSNQSFVSFTSGSFSVTAFSEVITTPVYEPVLSVVKEASSLNATVGDTIVYTSTITNSGNFGAAVTLTDLIPAGTVLVPNSVILNGSGVPGADPNTGIPIGIVVPGVSATVTFSVVITTLPPTQQLANQSTAAFTYTLPDGRTFTGSEASNVVTTQVSSPNVTVVKSTTFTATTVGDIVPFTVVVTNAGIDSVTNAILVDPIPANTTFIPGTVVVEGVPVPSANPATGVQLGTITAGSSVTVTFSLTVASLPASGTFSNQATVSFTSGAFSGTSLSNVVTLPVFQAIIGVVKGANVTVATVGDTVVYFLNITNTGNTPATVTLTDPVPTGAEFVPNTVIINGVPQPGIDPDLGIPVGTVPPGGTITVTVTLQVVIETLPSPQQLVNSATANFTFLLPDGRTITGASPSNTVIIPVSSPNVSVVKSTAAIDAVSGDTITYTILVTNNGITTVNNVFVIDPIPPGSTFVPGSVTINGVPSPLDNPAVGVLVGSIAAEASTTVTFQVVVS
jgi:large repetitive protein